MILTVSADELLLPAAVSYLRLVRDDDSGEKGPAGCPTIEFVKDTVNQSGDLGEKATIVAEEWPKCLRHGENELTMWKFEEDFIGQMLGKEDRALSTTGWAEIETLAGERPKVVMSAFGIRTADARDALEVVATY